MKEETSTHSEEILVTRREALQGLVGLTATSLLSSEALSESSARSGTQNSYDEKIAAIGSVRNQLFNTDWRFHRGDVTGAERPGFDDSAWRALDVPHDWSIEDLTEAVGDGKEAIWNEGNAPARVGPFDLYASQGQGATGWVVGGVGWYRKSFVAPVVPLDGKVEIRFEGVYMNADVWLNGVHLGNHPYGYTGFSFDLTGALRPGNNELAVRVNNTGRNSRWYSGSGIFRNVLLSQVGALRIPEFGVYVTTPEVAKTAAQVRVETTIENAMAKSQKAVVWVRLLGTGKSVVAEAREHVNLGPAARGVVPIVLKVNEPRLWSPADPQLYRSEIVIESEGKSVDVTSVDFGIRKVEIDAEHGLRINGASIKLKGGCVHHDNGPLGSACIERAEQRRVELMKANGFNAIRTSHNPPSPAFLDACDQLGMLVIDEAFDCWTRGKNPEDYHLYFSDWWKRDLESMVLRDRNHPCVIIWSIGNEIPERAEPAGVAIGHQLRAAVQKMDATRPVTAAICGPWDHSKQTWKDMEPAFTYLDVGGYNYEWKNYAPDHAAYPQRVMMGTESFPLETFQNWSAVEANSYVIGDFVWTGIDYLGESGIGNAMLAREGSHEAPPPFYPWFNSYCGDIDLIGDKKPQSYYRDVVWGRSMVEMAVQRPIPQHYAEELSRWGWSDELRSWTWPGIQGVPLRVRVYTRGDEVKLLLNGKEVGSTEVSDKSALTAEFEVLYTPGELKAVAYLSGREIGSIVFETAGPMRRIALRADRPAIRASRDDLAYVHVDIVDEQGRRVPDAAVPVQFAVQGAGELEAVGNANPKDVASFRRPERSTFHGACMVIVRPVGGPGTITLHAEAPGLEPASITVRTEPA
jgi:beta-galactosidase